MTLIKALVVEDSPAVREFLVHIFDSDPGIQVIGTASDGEEALEAVGRKRPDVITMDIHMPKLDGLEATRRIMETHPTPIVIVSGSADSHEVATTFRAMEGGRFGRDSPPPPARPAGNAGAQKDGQRGRWSWGILSRTAELCSAKSEFRASLCGSVWFERKSGPIRIVARRE